MKIPDWLRCSRRRVESAILIVLLVFSVAQSAYFNALDDKRQEHEAEQAERNSGENDCQTAYAVALTDALQDRDAVGAIARAALVEWVKSDRAVDRTFARLLTNPPPGDQGREEFLAALAEDDAATATYLTTLRRVTKTADINPYPDLAECFDQLDEKVAAQLAVRLVSFDPRAGGGRCLGRQVTIFGTRHGDVITGTNGRDVIRAGKGVDIISSGPGRDRICAGNGSDVANAGRALDRVNCGKGADIVQSAERRRNCEYGRH